MASDGVVRRALRAMGAATGQRFYTEEDEAVAVIAFAGQLSSFSDDAVNMAADEWSRTMAKFPTLVDFMTLVRKHQHGLDDERAIAAGPAPTTTYPVGKPGSEGLAALLVMRRMMREVAKTTPKGYFGRWAGLSSDRDAGPGLRDLGHDFDERNEHSHDCVRCHALATIAYEQVVEFEGSSATWEGSEGPDVEGLRSCRNALCDHGWVTTATMEQGRIVDRVDKCETCGGPKPPRLPKDAETITARRRKRPFRRP